MSSEEYFKIISITGAHSGVGKTTLCSILLRELEGFGAIKFTKKTCSTVDSRRSTVKKTQNSKLLTPNSLLVDDVNILNQRGKDTALFLESGAERVLWIQSPYSELEGILALALSRLRDLRGVIIEGNSPVDFLNPYLVIFIIDPKGEIKPSAIKVSKKADIVIINSEKQTKKHTLLFTEYQKKIRVYWIDLIKKKGEIDEFLCFVKERIGKSSH